MGKHMKSWSTLADHIQPSNHRWAIYGLLVTIATLHDVIMSSDQET